MIDACYAFLGSMSELIAQLTSWLVVVTSVTVKSVRPSRTAFTSRERITVEDDDRIWTFLHDFLF